MDFLIIIGVLSLFFIFESIFLYSKAYFWNYLILLIACLLIWRQVTNPSYLLQHLLFYPIGCFIWMPIFWYLSMLKTAREIRAGIIKYGSVNSYHNHIDTNLSKHFKTIPSVDRNYSYEVDIKHPPALDIVHHSIFYPVSIVVFFGENLMSIAYNSLVGMMESIRRSFSDKINNQFK